MKCLLVLVTVAAVGNLAAAAAAAASTCALSELYFARHNISADNGDAPGPVCGGQCCGRGREEHLQDRLEQRMGAALGLPPIIDLLLDTRRSLLEHLNALSQQSQNKTSVLFAQVYRGQAGRAHAPLAALYAAIRSYLRPGPAPDDLDPAPPSPSADITASAEHFFRDIFPVAFHNVLKIDHQFTPEYEACLRDAYVSVQPFGAIPQQVGTSLSRSLGGAQALLAALGAGAGVLGAAARLAARGSALPPRALLRASHCARCRGLDAKLCRNYCLNVFRGSIGSVSSELEGPWASYVDGVERVARLDADATLRTLHTRLSEAIMHAFENHLILAEKVRQECGPVSTLPAPAPRAPPASPRSDALRAPPPDAELLQFAASLAATKHLFAGLADHLCDDPDFAADGNDRCWNGEDIGEYTKPLVSSSSVSDQRYNPEVTGGAAHDRDAASLADRLRAVRQSLVTWSAAGGPAAEALMQGDEAEADAGSGSGRSDDDDPYDTEGSGEGSGAAPYPIEPKILQSPEENSGPQSSSAVAMRPASAAAALAVLLVQRALV